MGPGSQVPGRLTRRSHCQQRASQAAHKHNKKNQLLKRQRTHANVGQQGRTRHRVGGLRVCRRGTRRPGRRAQGRTHADVGQRGVKVPGQVERLEAERGPGRKAAAAGHARVGRRGRAEEPLEAGPGQRHAAPAQQRHQLRSAARSGASARGRLAAGRHVAAHARDTGCRAKSLPSTSV